METRQVTANRWAHAEAFAQVAIGAVLAQIVLWLFGVHLAEAVALNGVMLGVSYLRSYAIRRAFSKWKRQCLAKELKVSSSIGLLDFAPGDDLKLCS